MKVFINPGHDKEHDPGAVNPNSGLRECDVAAEVGALVVDYLEAAGCECRILQSDNLAGESEYADRKGQTVCGDANDWEADVFVSIHCNAANCVARGTEVECYTQTAATRVRSSRSASSRRSWTRSARPTAASRAVRACSSCGRRICPPYSSRQRLSTMTRTRRS